jgi:hypothetical protein
MFAELGKEFYMEISKKIKLNKKYQYLLETKYPPIADNVPPKTIKKNSDKSLLNIFLRNNFDFISYSLLLNFLH